MSKRRKKKNGDVCMCDCLRGHLVCTCKPSFAVYKGRDGGGAAISSGQGEWPQCALPFAGSPFSFSQRQRCANLGGGEGGEYEHQREGSGHTKRKEQERQNPVSEEGKQPQGTVQQTNGPLSALLLRRSVVRAEKHATSTGQRSRATFVWQPSKGNKASERVPSQTGRCASIRSGS